METTQSNDIPTKVIKIFKHLFAKFVCNKFNECLEVGAYLKKAEAILIYKKKERTSKNNYIPISI